MDAGDTFNILGTPLLATSYEALIAYVQELGKGERASALDFTNTHIEALRCADEHLRNITSCIDKFIPDGMPLIWLLNQRGAHLNDRVYGPTFMRRCLEKNLTPWKHYFLGGSEACLAALQERFHSANIVGARNRYFSPEEEPPIVEEIESLSPDLIWVGLGTSKQQEWQPVASRRAHPSSSRHLRQTQILPQA